METHVQFVGLLTADSLYAVDKSGQPLPDSNNPVFLLARELVHYGHRELAHVLLEFACEATPIQGDKKHRQHIDGSSEGSEYYEIRWADGEMSELELRYCGNYGSAPDVDLDATLNQSRPDLVPTGTIAYRGVPAEDIELRLVSANGAPSVEGVLVNQMGEQRIVNSWSASPELKANMREARETALAGARDYLLTGGPIPVRKSWMGAYFLDILEYATADGGEPYNLFPFPEAYMRTAIEQLCPSFFEELKRADSEVGEITNGRAMFDQLREASS